MSPLNRLVLTGLVSAALAAGGLFYFQQQRAREAGYLQWQNGRMQAEAYARLHAPATAVLPPLGTPGQASAPVVVTPVASPVLRRAPEIYRNEGAATPLAALQTFAWACDRGDTDTVGQLLHFDPAARTKAEAFMAALPEPDRAQWKSVEAMAVATVTFNYMASPFPGADVLDTATPELISDDRVRLRLPNTIKDRSEFQYTSTGWKYVITETLVDDYIARARAAAVRP